MKKMILIAIALLSSTKAMEKREIDDQDKAMLVFLDNQYFNPVAVVGPNKKVVEVLSPGEKRKVAIPFVRKSDRTFPIMSFFESRGMFVPEAKYKYPIALLTIPKDKDSKLKILQKNDAEGSDFGRNKVEAKFIVNNDSNEIVWAFNGIELKQIEPNKKEQFIKLIIDKSPEGAWSPIFFLTELSWYSPSGKKDEFVLTVKENGSIESSLAEDYLANQKAQEVYKSFSKEREPDEKLIGKFLDTGLLKNIPNVELQKSIVKYVQAKLGSDWEKKLAKDFSDDNNEGY